MWTINCYVSSSGKNEVQEVYDDGTDDLRAELEVALDYLTVRDRSEWRRPMAAKLSRCNTFRDFFEIRCFANNVQQRPIGYFGPGANDFTILLWAIEKGNELIPLDWCKMADRRRKKLLAKTATTKKLEL